MPSREALSDCAIKIFCATVSAYFKNKSNSLDCNDSSVVPHRLTKRRFKQLPQLR